MNAVATAPLSSVRGRSRSTRVSPISGETRRDDGALLRDPRIRSVAWRDLRTPTRGQVAWELGITLPWLVGSLWCAASAWWLPALVCSFFLFQTGVRQAHGAHHYTLGLTRSTTEWVMYALSVVMLGSMHAVQETHRRHHAHCLAADDVEGFTARLPWWGAILAGPMMVARIALAGLRAPCPGRRRWVYAELATSGLILCALFAQGLPTALVYHVSVMLLGHTLTGFFLVWTVHHDVDSESQIARTSRRPWFNALTGSMFFHLEHHLFPRVPTCNLARLAARIDAVAPELGSQAVV